MENREIIMSELKEISPLLTEINKENVYSVSPAYFNKVAELVIEKINLESKQGFHFSLVNPYTVSADYFDRFSQTVLEAIKNQHPVQNEVAEELSAVAPFLNKVSKRSVYEIPGDYFLTLNSAVHYKKPQTEVVPFGKRFSRLAVAAVVASTIAVGGYLLLGKDGGKTKAQAINVQSAVKGLRDDEIIEFLKRQNNTAASEKNKSNERIRKKLKQMTEDEIRQYLRENYSSGEIEVDI
jgi:hypothetical protein